MNGVEIRSYRPGDEREIVRFLQLVFEGWPNFDLTGSSVEHWRWKYLDNPWKKSFVSVALNGDDVIGANHAYPIKIKIGHKFFLCGYASDTAVHPKFRRIGIYKKIIDLKNQIEESEGHHLNLSVTSNPIMIRSHLRNPIMEPFPHKVFNLVRIRDLDLHLRYIPVRNQWFMRLGFHTVKLLNNLKKLIIRNDPSVKGSEVESIQKFDEGINEFAKVVSEYYEFLVKRDREYLNWRYCDPRAGKFVVKQVKDRDNRILGYSVLSVNSLLDDYPLGYLMDLMALPNRPDVAEFLIADAIQYFDSRDINIISCLMPEKHLYLKFLEGYGFLNSRIRVQLYCNYYVMGEAKEKIESTSANTVHYSYGDVDSLPTRMPRNTFQ